MSSFYNFLRESQALAAIELAAKKRSRSLNLKQLDQKAFPLSVLKLKDLMRLNVSHNKFKNIPDQIADLEYLEFLALDYNFLTTVPSEIGKLSYLVYLNLSYNNLGHLIPEIGQLHRLEKLWLNNTRLQSLPPEIGNCTHLDTFGARGNFIEELPSEIGNLKRLRWLTLDRNLLTTVPKEIVGLSGLVHLNLNNNRFETFPKIDELQALQFVLMTQNLITVIDTTVIENMTFVRKIDLRYNPIITPQNYTHIKNLSLDVKGFQNDDYNDDSDSEDWEKSLPTSELNTSDTSGEEFDIEEIFEDALPTVAKYFCAGL